MSQPHDDQPLYPPQPHPQDVYEGAEEEQHGIPLEEVQVATPVTTKAPRKGLTPAQIGVVAGTALIIGAMTLLHRKPAPVATQPVTPVIAAQQPAPAPVTTTPAPVATTVTTTPAPVTTTSKTSPSPVTTPGNPPKTAIPKVSSVTKPEMTAKTTGSTGGKKIISKEQSELADLGNPTADPIRNPFLPKTPTGAGSVNVSSVQARPSTQTVSASPVISAVQATGGQNASGIQALPKAAPVIHAAPVPHYTPRRTTAPTPVVQATPVEAAVPAPTLPSATLSSVRPPVTQQAPKPIVIRAVPAQASAPAPVILTPATPAPVQVSPPVVSRSGTAATPATTPAASTVTVPAPTPAAPQLNAVEQWVQNEHVSYGGKASSDGNTTAIVQAPSGPVFVTVGDKIPGTDITVKSAGNSELILTDGKTQAKLSLGQ